MSEPGDHAQEDRKRKKPCNRHNSQQVQGLEDFFKMCPHPDEVQRMALSKELGMESKQIKFWFQNKRTQSRTQQGRQDNSTLRADNDRMRTENIVFTQALKQIVCPTCGPKTTENCFLEEQRLRMDNLRLREEIDLIANMAEKYLGRPITELASLEAFPASPLELPVGGLGTQGLGPSLDLDLVPGNYPSAMPFPLSVVVPENEKSTMVETATSAMKNLIRLVQNDESLWLKEGSDGREVLHLETYYEIFPRLAYQFRSPDIAIEASRVSGLVMLNAMALVDIFMDASKWADLFSTIVSQARTIDVLSTGMPGSMDGYLVLMHAELQVLSPVVPTREFFFLRHCQKIKQDMWAIADVSFISGEDKLDSLSGSRKLPSGCVIRDLWNGYSEVTWVEHMAIKHKNPIHHLFRVLVHSGEAFGAHRWLSTLQRMCERIVAMSETSVGGKRIVAMAETSVGGIRADFKRSVLTLAQRMVKEFCSKLSDGRQWTKLSGLNGVEVRATVEKIMDPDHSQAAVLSAATSLWLPISSERIFNFLGDTNSRTLWDVMSRGEHLQEVTNIPIGLNLGNSISLLDAPNSSESNMTVLHENLRETWGSLVVYAPIHRSSIGFVMSGMKPSCIQILPSGFAILPHGWHGAVDGASTSSNPTGGSAGSLVTMLLQILIRCPESSKVSLESLAMVNTMINNTVQQIKNALCPPMASI